MDGSGLTVKVPVSVDDQPSASRAVAARVNVPATEGVQDNDGASIVAHPAGSPV